MINSEQHFPLTEAPAHCIGRPHLKTVMRWALKGVGPNRVKLQTWKSGGRRYTNQAAIDRFVAQLSGEIDAATALSQQRSEELARAEEFLDTDGVGDDGCPAQLKSGGRQKGHK